MHATEKSDSRTAPGLLGPSVSNKTKEQLKKATGMATCPECGERLFIPPGQPLSKFIDCDWCGAELEIVQVEPYRVEKAPSIEDAWGE
jgi:alpha-aminoadipate carrier protein LysW